MDYELAKKLRDAGFNFGWVLDSKVEVYGVETLRDDFIKIEDKWYLIPTLSKLIEACGNGFKSLVKMQILNPDGSLVYGSFANENEKWLAECLNDDFSSFGGTPEEAVANLYLALNKR